MFRTEKSASDIKSLALKNQTHEVDENAPPQRNRTTPLPKLQMTVICFVVICEPIVSSIIFPFIYPMVRSFHLSDDETEIGRYSGWVASSFYIAQFCTIMIWGRASDLIGRRPVLLVGLLGNSITSCLFGLSKSYWWAIGMRALCGIMNSNLGVIRTMLGEISDMSNKGEAFSLFSICYSTGLVLGPALGGYFVYPAKQLPWLFGHNQFLIDHPFFLPCFISSIASFTGFLLGFFYLKETNPVVIRRKQNQQVDERTHLLARPQQPKSLRDKFKTHFPKDCVFPILGQCIIFFLVITFDESLPLYVTSPTNVQGLGLTPAKFAIIWTSLGIVSVFYRFTIFPWGTRRFDSIKLLKFSHTLMFQMVPLAIYFLYLAMSLYYISVLLEPAILSPALLSWLVNQSATPETLGFVNGLCQACVALVSMFAPPFAGNIWSWSIKGDKPYPFDHHAVFYIAALIAILGILESLWIPKRVAYIKKTY